MSASFPSDDVLGVEKRKSAPVPLHLDEQKMRSMFTLAGIGILSVWKLPNAYWPEALPDDWSDQGQVDDFLHYAQIRSSSPWWLVKTHLGLIRIGCRKRVIEIDWSDTAIRAIITQDDVTKDNTMVHAWGGLKAVEYLQNLVYSYVDKTA